MRHVYREQYRGFQIDTYALPEYVPPEDEYAQDVESGKLEWFCAQVCASKDGIQLAQEYLGCCLYPLAEDFIKDSGYYVDMRNSAVEMAVETIKLLAQSLEEFYG